MSNICLIEGAKREAPPRRRGSLSVVGSLRGVHLRLEFEALTGAVDEDRIARAELAVYDAAREGVLDVASDGAGEWPGAELGIVALLGEELPGLGRNLDGDP